MTLIDISIWDTANNHAFIANKLSLSCNYQMMALTHQQQSRADELDILRTAT